MAPFSACPWVMAILGELKQAQLSTLKDIPHSLLFPTETRYSHACVILYSRAHYNGISLDLNTSHGIHVFYDGTKKEKVQVVSLDDPISKYATGFEIIESWYVKVERISVAL